MPPIDGGGPGGLPSPSPSTGTTTGDILSIAARQLLDITGSGWNALTVLLPYLNLGILEIINLVPSAYTDTVTLTLNGGPRQELPEGSFGIIDAVGNLASDGVTPGATIRSLEKERLDSIFPGWMQFTATAPLSLPAAPTGTAAITGGSMADGTYYYIVTALNALGETVKGAESAAKTISGGTGHGSVPLTWATVAGATSYRVYRTTTPGVYSNVNFIASSTNSATDSSMSVNTGTPPTGSSSLTGVSFIVIDPRNPMIFYVFPPPVAPGIQLIQAVLSTSPDAITAVDGDFPIDDSFKPACVDYIVYRALAEETTIPNAMAKSQQFHNQFIQDLGLKGNVKKQSEDKQ